MLFIISGYLYALHDYTPNKQRIGKRARTLVLPYLLWSAIGIALTYLLEYFPLTRAYVERSHVMQIDQTRLLLHDYHWYEVIGRWLFFPVSYQLWFIRVLFIYNAAYPFIRNCVLNERWRWVFFSVAMLMWLGTAGLVFIEGEGLLFFSLGVWMQKTGFNISVPKAWLNPFQWGALFFITSLVKTYLAFEGQALIGNAVFQVITLLHKLTVLSGLIACWFGLDWLVRGCMKRQWFVWLTSFSFIIYALHAPFVAIFIDAMLDALHPLGASRILAFVLLPIVIISICIFIGLLVRTALPKVYSVLTGGRGM
jgi:fucose 4-O-acetylase-like acetyltransferase